MSALIFAAAVVSLILTVLFWGAFLYGVENAPRDGSTLGCFFTALLATGLLAYLVARLFGASA